MTEKQWAEFERELEKAMAEDKRMTEQEYQAWLDTLPEHIPPYRKNRKRDFLWKDYRKRDASCFCPEMAQFSN